MTKVSNGVKEFYNYIDRLLLNNSLSHAYLIEINDYDRDYADVLKFVKLILCKNNKLTADLNCDLCNICNLIDNNLYPDLYVIEPDGAFIKKEQIVKLEEEFSNYSLLDNKRIYIIKEADKMNDSSANTILKFLEEPNDGIVALLLTNNRYKIIDTIVSRCQILSLNSFNSIDNIDNYRFFINNLVNPNDLFINYDDIINNLFIKDEKISKNLMNDFFEKLSVIFLDYYNDNLKEKKYSDDLIEDISKLSKEDVFRYLYIIENEITKLSFNVNNKLWLDSLFSKFIGGYL